jgi:hypothetical protein
VADASPPGEGMGVVTRGAPADPATGAAPSALATVDLGDVAVALEAPAELARFVSERFALAPAGVEPAVVSRVVAGPAPAGGVPRGRRIAEAAGRVWCRSFPGLPELTVAVARGVAGAAVGDGADGGDAVGGARPDIDTEVYFDRPGWVRLYKRLVAGVGAEQTWEQLSFYGLLFPALLGAERRGRFPLHAGAVARGDRALVLSGLPGCGKSTVAAALERRGWTLASDNLVTVSAAGVWPLPEPVRLDAGSRALAGVSEGDGAAATYGRTARRLEAPRRALHAAALVLLERGDRTSLEAAEVSAGHLIDLGRLAYELHAYDLYRSFARLAVGGPPAGEEATVGAWLAPLRTVRLTVADGEVDAACDLLGELA